MLLHPTLEKLSALRLTGMTAALNEQQQMDLADLRFEERLGLLLDREMAVRETRKMKTRLQKAKLRQDRCLEDIDFRHPRGLDKSLVLRLADCQWLKEHHNFGYGGIRSSIPLAEKNQGLQRFSVSPFLFPGQLTTPGQFASQSQELDLAEQLRSRNSVLHSKTRKYHSQAGGS